MRGRDAHATRGFWVRTFLIAVVFFVGVAPTLSWLEFSGGSENLVVGTVLEMRRGGPWVVPTLKGEPRTTKPPLATWVGASFVSDRTMEGIREVDSAKRQAAYARLAWEVRWPALVSACLMLIGVGWLGKAVADERVGLLAAVMAGSSIMWLRFGRSATTDVQLALWVTVANAGLMWGVFAGRWLKAGLIAGVALGLAMMSKGPVALVQTVVPLGIFLVWRKWSSRGHRPDAYAAEGIKLLAVTMAVALVIALPWPVYVLSQNSQQLSAWWREIFRTSEEGFGRDPAYVYLAIVPLLVPWCGLLILGVVSAVWEREEKSVAALVMVVAPILVMALFKDKAERYLLPMLGPAAVLSAQALVRERDRRYAIAKKIAIGFMFGALIVVGVGLPLERAKEQWWSWNVAVLFAIAMLGVILFAWFRRRLLIMMGAAAVVMLGAHALFLHGYRNSPNGRSEMKPLADAIVERAGREAIVMGYQREDWWGRVPNDLGIYLDKTIRAVGDVGMLIDRRVPQVVVVYVPDGVAVPKAFEGWEWIGATRRNKGEWRAYSLRR
jgi:4-amino-4-deoxy-L-arabinose transferase-like glycosyltransferase